MATAYDNDDGQGLQVYYPRAFVAFTITALAASAVAVVATSAIGITSVTRVKRKSDPSRTSVPWLRAAILLATISIIISIAHHSVQLDDTKRIGQGFRWTALDVTKECSNMFEYWARAALVVALASLSSGIHLVTCGDSKLWQRIVPWAFIFSAFVIGALAVAICAISIRVNLYHMWLLEQSSISTSQYDDAMFIFDLWVASTRLVIVLSIVTFVASLGSAVLSFAVLSSSSDLRRAAVIGIVANMFNVVGALYHVVVSILENVSHIYNLFDFALFLRIILTTWTVVVALILVTIALAIREGGVWTLDVGSRRSKDEEVVEK